MDDTTKSMRELLNLFIEKRRLKGRLYQHQVKAAWVKAMGPTISGYTKDIKLVRKVLYLTVESAALKQEMNFSKDKIKDIMNAELGEDYIQKVVVR